MKPYVKYIVLAAILVAFGLGAYSMSRFGYEEPDYRIEKKEGNFEIRIYDSMTVASVEMADGSSSSDRGFMELFGYISGQNESGQKIAMTVPVFLDRENESANSMSFVLPRNVAEMGAPAANSDRVGVSSREMGKVAVMRFRGGRSSANEQQAASQLLKWVEDAGMETLAKPFFAYYDPPYTPGFLRRNEVVVRIVESP